MIWESHAAPSRVRQAGRHCPEVMPARSGDHRWEHDTEVLKGRDAAHRERRCRTAFSKLARQRALKRRPDLLPVHLHLSVLLVPDHDDLNPWVIQRVKPAEHVPAFRVQHRPRIDQQHLGSGRQIPAEQCRLVPVQVAHIGGIGEAGGQLGGIVRQRAHRVLAVRVPLANLFAVVREITAAGQVVAAWGYDGNPQQLVALGRPVIAAEGRGKRLVLTPELRPGRR